MDKKFTLKEAFSKCLLYYNELVDLELLYTPYKILLKEGRYNQPFRGVSLYSYFGNKNSRDRFLTGKISRNVDSGEIIVKTSPNIFCSDESEGEEIASKLLSNEAYNIRACYQKHEKNFWIYLDPDMIVSFAPDDEFPILELPEHKAYTLPTE